MIALAILGLMLTSLLTVVGYQYDANVRARNLTVSTGAARCKMSEVEEKLLKDGYPETDQFEDGPCCDGESPAGMSCHVAVERVTLPDPPSMAGGDGGVGGMGGGAGGAGGGSGFGALAALAGAAQNPGSLGDGGIGGLASMLAGGMGGGTGDPSAAGAGGMPGMPGGGVNGIAGMAMTIVYPQLKPLLEASIRRVTVDVIWNEGPNERKTTIVQFVTNPQRGLPPVLDPSMAGAMDGGVPGASAGGVGMPGAAGISPIGGAGIGTPRIGGM
jgi:general secretion pathway protein I